MITHFSLFKTPGLCERSQNPKNDLFDSVRVNTGVGSLGLLTAFVRYSTSLLRWFGIPFGCWSIKETHDCEEPAGFIIIIIIASVEIQSLH